MKPSLEKASIVWGSCVDGESVVCHAVEHHRKTVYQGHSSDPSFLPFIKTDCVMHIGF